MMKKLCLALLTVIFKCIKSFTLGSQSYNHQKSGFMKIERGEFIVIKQKVLIAFVIINLFGFAFAEIRTKPFPLEQLTDPDSPSYVPIPYPKNETEAIIDLKYAITKHFSDNEDSHEVYVGSTPPSAPFKEVLLSWTKGKSHYRIGEIAKVKNLNSNRTNCSDWLFIFLNEDNKIAARVALVASGLLGGAIVNPPDKRNRLLISKTDVINNLTVCTGFKISEKDVISIDRVILIPSLGNHLSPTWEVSLTNGKVFYYCEFRNKCYKIKKRIPWNKNAKGQRPYWQSLVKRSDIFAYDGINDCLLVFEKIK
jgi:hypothetical protein